MIAIKNYLGMTESTVMDCINHQDLPAEKVKGVWEVDQAAVDRWKNPQPQKKSRSKAAKSKKKKSAATGEKK